MVIKLPVRLLWRRVAKTFVVLNVNISGVDELKKLARDVIRWCASEMNLEDVKISVSLFDDYDDKKCWGDCEQVSETEYNIRACTDQDIRDFVATITHEMVHVEQWVKNEWSGDGEKEAEKRQYKLADKYYWFSDKERIFYESRKQKMLIEQQTNTITLRPMSATETVAEKVMSC